MDKHKIQFAMLLSGVLCLLTGAFSLLAPYPASFVINDARPKGPVTVVNDRDGWKLLVGGKPFFVKGVCYRYTPIGSGDQADVCANIRGSWIEDGDLMARMGVNAIRLYQQGCNEEDTRTIIRDMFNKYGIKTAIGHFLGYWDWPYANYADPAFREKQKSEVLDMVRKFKDEDGILFWILGNENNYSFDQGVRDWSTAEIENMKNTVERREAKARIYYSFINDIAKAIKEIDPNHPVVMGNGELASINIAKEQCPDVDILGGIVYQGKTFGTYFDRLEKNLGKPNVFIEFGADSYDADLNAEAQDWQAFFIKLQWLEIEKNRTRALGAGNSLGGFVFEWVDEWWKHNPGHKQSWYKHDTLGSWSNTAYYFDAKARNNMNEEWFGVVALDPDINKSKNSIEKRYPRKAYYALKSLWLKKHKAHRAVFGALSVLFLAMTAAIFLLQKKKSGD